MRWAVTGASGFIGGALVRSLELDGIKVRTLTRTLPTRAGQVRGDVRDEAALRELIDGADMVVHAAAYVHRTVRSANEREECFSVNAGATETLARLIAARETPPHLIYISSASVYGTANGPLDERSPLAPDTPYGESKRDAERIVETVGATILRPPLVFGPGAPGNLQRLLRMIRMRVVLELRGGAQRKSLLPVEDLVAAIRTVARERSVTRGETFNIASATLTMREIVTELAAALDIRPLRVPLPSFLPRVASHIPAVARLVAAYVSDVILDDAKLRARTAYLPVVDVRAALRRVALAGEHQQHQRHRG